MSVKDQKRSEKKKTRGKETSKTKVDGPEAKDRGTVERKLDILAETIERELGLPSLESSVEPKQDILTEAIESELDLLAPEPSLETEKRLKEQEAAKLRTILPPWCEKPWMYVTPTNPDQLNSWSSAWGDFMLEYAEIKTAHILNLLELRKEFPFSNRIIKKQLSIGQLQQIGVALIEKDFAAWRDERQTRLRVYWRGLDEWSETLYEWALQNGFEMVSLFELTNVGEVWSTLPLEELLQIIQMLVTRNRAKWLGKDKKTVLFNFSL